MSEQILVELIRLIPSFLWLVLVAVVLGVFYRPIRQELIPRMSGFKAFGFEVALLREELDKAVDKQGVEVGQSDRTQVLRRAEMVGQMMRGARILWVDDHPENNEYEHRIMRSLGAIVDTARSSAEARSMLSRTNYALVISDIDRDGVPDEGLRFLEDMYERGPYPRTVLYVGSVDLDKGVPAHAFGITDRPDELLHLVMDGLERERA